MSGFLQNICKNAKVIYISVPLEEIYQRIENLQTRGIAGLTQKHFAKIYLERKALYEKYADITVDAAFLTKDQLLKAILKEIR